MSMIKRLLHRVGLIDSNRLEARDGKYNNVFCPHCGEFIPSNYGVLVRPSVAGDGLTFDCPNCDRSGAVLAVVDYEPLVDFSELESHNRFVPESVTDEIRERHVEGAGDNNNES